MNINIINFAKTNSIQQKNNLVHFGKTNTLKQDTVCFSQNFANINSITADEESFNEFIDPILKNPRFSSQKAKKLILNSGGQTYFAKKYFQKDGYKDKYKAKIEKLVDEAQTPEELLKISPNWFPWVFRNKFGQDYHFGNLPKDFNSIEEYRNLTTRLLKGEHFENIKELNGGESGKRVFLIKQNNKKYILKIQNDYTIYSDELKKAIEKDNWLQDSFIQNYKDNEAMKSDSSYINAMLDFYLNLNNCENASKIHFYDSKTSSVLYEYTQGEPLEENLDILETPKILEDLEALGIQYNDVNKGNFKIKNGVIKIIDIGESNFNDILRPTISGYQFELPNWSGNSLNSFNLCYLNK